MPTLSPAQFAAMGGKTNTQTTDYSPLQNFISKNVPGAVTPKNVSPASPALKSFIDTGAAPGAQAPKQGVLANLGSSIIPAAQQVGSELKNDVVEPLSDAFQGKQSGGSAGLQTVGNLLNTAIVKPGNEILSPISKAWQGITNILNPVVDTLSGSKQGTTAQTNSQAVQQAANAYNQWSSAHPEAAKDLEALGNIGQAGMTVAGTESLAEGAQAGAERITPQIKELGGKIVDVANTAADKFSNALPDMGKAETVAPEDSLKTAQEARSNPPTGKETAKADAEGRTSIVNGKKVISEPTTKETGMDNALKPLVEDGKITTEKDPATGLIKAKAQEANIGNVSDELEKETTRIRSQTQQADQTSGEKFDTEKADKLKSDIDKIKPPRTLKSDSALAKRMSDFNDTAKEIIDDEVKSGSGKVEGGLNAKQNLGKMIKTEMPKTFENDHISAAMEQHAQKVYELFNQSTAADLPDGKLPDGSDYRASLKNQSSLIDAQGEMAEKYAREYKVGEGEWKRIMQAHPSLKLWGRRIGMGLAIGTVFGGSVYTVGKDIRNAILGK